MDLRDGGERVGTKGRDSSQHLCKTFPRIGMELFGSTRVDRRYSIKENVHLEKG